MSEAPWPDLSGAGMRLRMARDGLNQVLLIDAPDGSVTPKSAAALATIGFRPRGGALIRNGLDVTVGELREALGRDAVRMRRIPLADLHASALPDVTPVDRLNSALGMGRFLAHETLEKSIAAVKLVAGRGEESTTTFWSRWRALPGASEWAHLDGGAIARWMDAQLRTERYVDDAAGLPPRLPDIAIGGAAAHDVRCAIVAYEREVEEFSKQHLSVLEERARDVAALLGETPRVKAARDVIATANDAFVERRLALESALREAIEESTPRFELLGDKPRWEVPEDSALGLDQEGQWFAVQAGDRLGWSQNYIVDFGGAIEAAADRVAVKQAPARMLPWVEDTESIGVAVVCPVGRAQCGDSPPRILFHDSEGGGFVRAIEERYVAHFESRYPGGTWRCSTVVGRTRAGLYFNAEDELVGIAIPSDLLTEHVDAWERALPALQAEAAGAHASPALADGDTEQPADTERTAPRRRHSRADERERIEDFGEKIGGARKDLAALSGRGLLPGDVTGWTAAERKELVTKARIWPAPDYRKLVHEEGCDPTVAWARKQIRDVIRGDFCVAGPRRRYYWDEQQATAWHATVATIAKELEDVKTPEQMSEVAARYVVRRTREGRDWQGKPTQHECFETTAALSALDGATSNVRGTWRTLCDVFTAYTPPLTPGRIAVLERQRERANWPPAPDAQAAGRKRRDVVRIDVRPQLEGIERVGDDVRRGQPASTDDMLSVFRFRGGEWGRWQSQQDRSQTLDHAFDALHDLADVTGLPPEAVSLNGTLAIAFGARGSGGRGAALAHYEPLRRVINLTKMSGAGCLAHEWAHAFDNYLASPSGGARYASQDPNRAEDLGVVQALKGVMKAIGERPLSDEELTRLREERVVGAKRLVSNARWSLEHQIDAIAPLVRAWARFGGAVTEAKWDHILAVYRQEMLDPVGETPLRKADEVRSAYEEFREQLRAAGAKLHGRKLDIGTQQDWRTLGEAVTRLASMHRAEQYVASEVGAPLPSMEDRVHVSSNFATNAHKIDQFERRPKPYWAQTIECFARAFESYVFDRLEAQGRRSDYLVHGVEEVRFAEAESGNPYPEGEERRRINAAFDGLMAAVHEAALRKTAHPLFVHREQPPPTADGGLQHTPRMPGMAA